MSLLVLSASHVDHITSYFTPSGLQALMARVFQCISSPEKSPPIVYNPLRTSIPTPNHTALFMPARLSQSTLHWIALKVVSVPRNPADKRGLPASTVVIDESTGAVKAIVNARNLTALRNAAGSLLSTNIVRLHNPTSIVAFGAGKQIEAHLDLHLRFFPSITSCTIINRTINLRVEALKALLEARFPAVSFKFLVNSEQSMHAPVSPSDNDIKIALLSAPIIICATPSTTPLFPSSWVNEGTHVILIGSYTPAMREVDRELIRRAINPSWRDQEKRQILMVDSWEACSLEAGELIDAGVEASQIAEIGEMVEFGCSGELILKPIFRFDHDRVAKSRDSSIQKTGSGPITMFKCVGIGLQDVAIASAVVAKAEELEVGDRITNYDIS